MLKKNILDKNGFTVVEVLVVISIGLILLTLSFVSASQARIKTRDKVRVADINTIRLALEEYKLHCGEYPRKLEANVDNGCHHGEKLSDYLSQIPTDPHSTVDDDSLFGSSYIAHDNHYLYAGLSRSSGGKCYDYHIGVQLEDPSGHFLNEDHDAPKNSGFYSKLCQGSHSDFGHNPAGSVGDNYDDVGLYDFRSDASI